ncbi:MAG TPA: cytochrome c biogenesis protein CcdA [Desulfobacterales bacterium]|nr:cytochrome c biogenesis protein CcdA [Desulfobacterales bacterium]
MLESFFVTINGWMAGGTVIAAAGCFIWGMVSVAFSPCHLASIPLIVAYVGGQEKTVNPGQAGFYSVLFTTGLFITIALIGILCAMLGRMLGDLGGNYLQILIGLVLIWVALGMLGFERYSMSGSLLHRLKLKGHSGAFVLGLAYGILSGSCTFGFIAPILAIITVQQKIVTGIIFIVLFGIGHCIPIAIAGSSMALVRKLMENRLWQGAGIWFRKGAGFLIGMMGLYFIFNPFIEA